MSLIDWFFDSPSNHRLLHMIKYLFFHAVSTFILFTVWVNNLRFSSSEIGMAPVGIALILIILLTVGITLSLLFRRQLQGRSAKTVGLIIYLFLFQLFPLLGAEPWMEGITNSGAQGMINRAFVLTPLITGLLTWIIIFLREPKRIDSNQ